MGGFNCGICKKKCGSGSIFCSSCKLWVHLKCTNLTFQEAKKVNKESGSLICMTCKKGDNLPLIKQATDTFVIKTLLSNLVDQIAINVDNVCTVKDKELEGGIVNSSQDENEKLVYLTSRDGTNLFTAKQIKNADTVHGKVILKDEAKFLILKVLCKTWSGFDEDLHCCGSYIKWHLGSVTNESKVTTCKANRKRKKVYYYESTDDEEFLIPPKKYLNSGREKNIEDDTEEDNDFNIERNHSKKYESEEEKEGNEMDVVKHNKDLLTESDISSDNEEEMKLSITSEDLKKSQVFTLLLGNEIVGDGAYFFDDKDEEDTNLPPETKVTVSRLNKKYRKSYVIGNQYQWKTNFILRKLKDKKSLPRKKKEWQRTKIKRLRAHGKSYTSKTSSKEFKVRPARERKPKSCKCRFTECSELTESDLELTFQRYYRIGDQEKQKFNLLQNIVDIPKKRARQELHEVASKRRERAYTRKYYINGKHVCKLLFMHTYCVSSGQIDRIVKKRNESEGIVLSIDKRGKHKHRRMVSDNVIKDLQSFVAKLPKYSSHYGREKNDKNILTLAPGVTKQDLYEVFIKEHEYIISKEWFLRYWKENIPVKLYKSHVDTCDICNDYTLTTAQKNNHKIEAYQAREAMKEDRDAITFDLQKAHVIPVLTTNKAYYKHQLVLYNEGIHDTRNNQGYSHLWTEDIGKRGSREVASIIYRFVKNHCNNRSNLSFWCDNCGGQNKNQYIAKAMIYIVNTIPNIKKIDLRFPYKGHTFLPDDSNFGSIEKQLRKKDLMYSIDDFEKAISNANSYRKDKKKGKKNKIIVYKMKRDDIKEFDLEVLIKRNIDKEGEKFNWTAIHHMQFKEGSMNMNFRYDSFGDSAFRIVNLAKRGVELNQLKSIKLQRLYNGPIKIKGEKYKDLMDQLKFIPPTYHEYYKSLKHHEIKKKNNDEDEDEDSS